MMREHGGGCSEELVLLNLPDMSLTSVCVVEHSRSVLIYSYFLVCCYLLSFVVICLSPKL